MPMTTMLVKRWPSRPVGHSRKASRATSICARISPVPRLRTSGIVPVWQNLQVSVQPTWVETHKAPRSSSGMKTASTSCPSGKRRSHLQVPSAERCSAAIAGRAAVNTGRQPQARLLRQRRHGRNVVGATMIEPVEELPCPQPQLGIGLAHLAQCFLEASLIEPDQALGGELTCRHRAWRRRRWQSRLANRCRSSPYRALRCPSRSSCCPGAWPRSAPCRPSPSAPRHAHPG